MQTSNKESKECKWRARCLSTIDRVERFAAAPLLHIGELNARDRCDVAISRRQPPRPRIAPASFFPKLCAHREAERATESNARMLDRRSRSQPEMDTEDEKEQKGSDENTRTVEEVKIARADGAKIVPLFAF